MVAHELEDVAASDDSGNLGERWETASPDRSNGTRQVD